MAPTFSSRNPLHQPRLPAVPCSVSWVAMRTYATILVLLLLTIPVYAVDTLQVTTPDPLLEAWRWTELDRSNGLIGRVRDVYEDRDGGIWFATDRGVNRYDGHGWTSYSPPDGFTGLSAVCQTSDGQMWFGTRHSPARPRSGRVDNLYKTGGPRQQPGVTISIDAGPRWHTVGRPLHIRWI